MRYLDVKIFELALYAVCLMLSPNQYANAGQLLLKALENHNYVQSA